MVNALILIVALILAIITFMTLAYAISSIWEREKRAAILGGAGFLILLGMEIAIFYLKKAGFFHSSPGLVTLIGGLVVICVILVLLTRRTAPNPRALQGTKGYIVGEVERFDEREQVFARNRALRPGSEQYRMFYSEHPQWEENDAQRRGMGGPLGQPGTIDKPYGGPNVAATMACLSIPLYLGTSDKVQPEAHPVLRGKRISMNPEEATNRVKNFALHVGADLVGVTEINPLWVYARRGEIFYGNWEEWGREIESAHKYAIVFAMEMSRDMVMTAPHTPTTIESMANYAKGAFIAIQLGSFIVNLGYSAKAHHLRHYDVLLVPLAIDAGLGELGRIGYLVTKQFGPRVRLGAVTTDLPLIPDSPVDIGVEDFCRICKKCARCCPSRSIPLDDVREVNGSLRWKLNAETCFGYWGKIGTDCCICMRVCPWSHPRTLPHRVINELVIRNRIARRVFSSADDFFYGRRPKRLPAPKWVEYKAIRNTP